MINDSSDTQQWKWIDISVIWASEQVYDLVYKAKASTDIHKILYMDYNAKQERYYMKSTSENFTAFGENTNFYNHID